MFGSLAENVYLCTRKTERLRNRSLKMVPVVQLVRASDCGSECRRFESVRAPKARKQTKSSENPINKGFLGISI